MRRYPKLSAQKGLLGKRQRLTQLQTQKGVVGHAAREWAMGPSVCIRKEERMLSVLNGGAIQRETRRIMPYFEL